MKGRTGETDTFVSKYNTDNPYISENNYLSELSDRQQDYLSDTFCDLVAALLVAVDFPTAEGISSCETSLSFRNKSDDLFLEIHMSPREGFTLKEKFKRALKEKALQDGVFKIRQSDTYIRTDGSMFTQNELEQKVENKLEHLFPSAVSFLQASKSSGIDKKSLKTEPIVANKLNIPTERNVQGTGNRTSALNETTSRRSAELKITHATKIDINPKSNASMQSVNIKPTKVVQPNDQNDNSSKSGFEVEKTSVRTSPHKGLKTIETDTKEIAKKLSQKPEKPTETQIPKATGTNPTVLEAKPTVPGNETNASLQKIKPKIGEIKLNKSIKPRIANTKAGMAVTKPNITKKDTPKRTKTTPGTAMKNNSTKDADSNIILSGLGTHAVIKDKNGNVIWEATHPNGNRSQSRLRKRKPPPPVPPPPPTLKADGTPNFAVNKAHLLAKKLNLSTIRHLQKPPVATNADSISRETVSRVSQIPNMPNSVPQTPKEVKKAKHSNLPLTTQAERKINRNQRLPMTKEELRTSHPKKKVDLPKVDRNRQLEQTNQNPTKPQNKGIDQIQKNNTGPQKPDTRTKPSLLVAKKAKRPLQVNPVASSLGIKSKSSSMTPNQKPRESSTNNKPENLQSRIQSRIPQSNTNPRPSKANTRFVMPKLIFLPPKPGKNKSTPRKTVPSLRKLFRTGLNPGRRTNLRTKPRFNTPLQTPRSQPTAGSSRFKPNNRPSTFRRVPRLESVSSLGLGRNQRTFQTPSVRNIRPLFRGPLPSSLNLNKPRIAKPITSEFRGTKPTKVKAKSFIKARRSMSPRPVSRKQVLPVSHVEHRRFASVPTNRRKEPSKQPRLLSWIQPRSREPTILFSAPGLRT